MGCVAVVALAMAGCSDGDDMGDDAASPTTSVDAPASPTTVPTSTSTSTVAPATTTTTAPPQPVGVVDLATVVCAGQPARAVGAATRPLAESWTCTSGADNISLHVFGSTADRDESLNRLLGYYASTGDTRPLSGYPYACGENWTIETDFPAVRDRVVATLVNAGVSAAPC